MKKLLKKVTQIKKGDIIFNNVIDRPEDEPYKEFYYVQDFVYEDADNYDIYLQKIWGNYTVIHKSDADFLFKRYSVYEEDDPEYDDILKLLENADIVKEELDDIVLRCTRNDGGNKLDKRYKNKWIPLKLSKSVTIRYSERVELELGVTIRVPKKYEAWLYLYDSFYEEYGIIQERPVILDYNHSKLKDWKIPVIMINPNFVKYIAHNTYGYHYHGENTVDDTEVIRIDDEVTLPAGMLVGKFRLFPLNTNILVKDRTGG